jgi:hypothetical protein
MGIVAVGKHLYDKSEVRETGHRKRETLSASML